MDMHRVFRALPGESLRINPLEHLVVQRLYLEHPLGISRVLLWTESAQGPYFVMASGPNYFEPEILGYTAVEIASHEGGFDFQGTVYTPVRSKHDTWFDEERTKAVDIYECFADTGADILVVALLDDVRGFAFRSRYNWQNVQ